MSPLLLILALILDAICGEPKWLWTRAPHPAVLMGRLISICERHLYADTRIAGVAVLVICATCALGVGFALSMFGPVIEVIATAILLAQNALVAHVRRVAEDLRISIPSARRSLAMIVSRETATLERPEIARAAIESGAENMSDGVIAPAIWALIGGLPGLCLYKMVNTADSMIGYRTERYEHFGWAAARLDDVMNWGPARLTGLGFWLTGGMRGTWSEIARDAKRHKSPNAGWPEAALSRALGLAVAGPRRYHGTLQDLPWVNGSGRRDLFAADIDAAIAHLWRVWALFVITCGAATALL